MFKKYVKKPIEIQAMEFNDTRGDIDILQEVLGEKFISKTEGYFIKTLEGEMKISQGDFIICGIKGEYYPCKPDIFEASYEKVSYNRVFENKDYRDTAMRKEAGVYVGNVKNSKINKEAAVFFRDANKKRVHNR